MNALCIVYLKSVSDWPAHPVVSVNSQLVLLSARWPWMQPNRLYAAEHNWAISPVRFSPQPANSSFLCSEEHEPAAQHKANIRFSAQMNSLSCDSFSSSRHDNKRKELKWMKREFFIFFCLDVKKQQRWECKHLWCDVVRKFSVGTEYSVWVMVGVKICVDYNYCLAVAGPAQVCNYQKNQVLCWGKKKTWRGGFGGQTQVKSTSSVVLFLASWLVEQKWTIWGH